MDEAKQSTRTVYVIALCCVAAIGGFLFGFDSGVYGLRWVRDEDIPELEPR